MNGERAAEVSRAPHAAIDSKCGSDEWALRTTRGQRDVLVPVRVIERFDRRPDPVGLLFEQTAERDRIGCLCNTHQQALAWLILARRHDQGLNRGFALAFFQREEQAVETPAAGRA